MQPTHAKDLRRRRERRHLIDVRLWAGVWASGANVVLEATEEHQPWRLEIFSDVHRVRANNSNTATATAIVVIIGCDSD